ncbi:hypothetical protein [Allomuricauda sp. d1]|uniref:hypothetical protein n=1 Tax=Allomuricauda sp. d1 TaxID=3136725 RepID=UPI0031D07F5D
MKPKVRLILTALATIIGAFSLLLFTTLVQDVFFKEINYCVSNRADIAFKTMALMAAGGIVGFKASLIVVRSNFWPHVLISFGLLAQLFFITGCPQSANPFWFDVFQNFSLVAGLWVGSFAALKFPLAPV